MNTFQHSISELWQDLLLSISTSFESRQDKIYLSIILIIGAITRGYFLTKPMRYDEAYTFLNFVNKELSHMFFYPLPNNHVLHTILVKLSVLVWGAHPETIRLPAFFAGLLIIPLTFLLCRIVAGGKTGLLASMAVAVSPYIISYSTNARGYTLLVFLSLLLAFLGLFFVKKPLFPRALVISSVAALGMFTIPSMLFVIVGLYTWIGSLLLIKGQSFKAISIKFFIPCSIMTSFFTVFLYAPVVLVSGGVESLISNRFVISQPWIDFFYGIYPHIQLIFSDFRGNVPNPVIYGGLIFLIIGLYASKKEKKWASLLLLPSLFFAAGIVFFANRRIPFVRTWIYILPFLFIIIDLGFIYFNKKLPDRFQSLFSVFIILFGTYFAIHLISNSAISQYYGTGKFSEVPIAVKYLKPLLDDDDIVHVRLPNDWPTYFYLWYYGTHEGSQTIKPDTVDEFFVVKKGEYTIDDMTEEPVTELFVLDELAVYQKIHIDEQ